ncbi:L,D-transpeptidase [Thiorhodovibrio winogradskyi]|nr:L,D-transpeptidase [Thiorhodovibrio winogradskyi]
MATTAGGDAQSGCQKLRQAGHQCFLTRLDVSTIPSESSDIPGTEQRQNAVPDAKPIAERTAEPIAEPTSNQAAKPIAKPIAKQADIQSLSPPTASPVAAVSTQPTTEQPGMQLALYHDRSMAEQGWQLLHARFPDLLGDVIPVYTQLYHYIALRAVAGDALERDRICASLRQRGAECLPTPVAFSGSLATLHTQTDKQPPNSVDTDRSETKAGNTDRAPDVPSSTAPTDAEADAYPVEDGTEDNRHNADREENAEATSGEPLDADSAPADTETQSTPPPPPPKPPARFGQGGATLDYSASPLGPDSILISIADRKLLYHAKDGTIYVWPVAIGRHWSYHIFGDTQITVKRPNPTWTPPPDMRKRNPKLPTSMGPGPRNPLGAYALNLGFPYIRIHGTDQPRTVGRAASSGCYRMHADAIKFLFQSVSVGTPVRITPEPLASLMPRTAAR